MKTERVTKAEIAYEYIKTRILKGTFTPGYRLILGEIARDTEVSEYPVREALKRLDREGYVTYERNAGARVAELDAELYESSQQVIAVLEGAATGMAAPFIDTATLDRAAALNAGMKESRERYDAEEFIRLNAEFHALLCSFTPSRHLLELLEQERLRLPLRPTFGIIMRHSQQFVEDHDELVQLIRSGVSSSEIQIFSQAHKMRVLETVKSATESANPL